MRQKHLNTLAGATLLASCCIAASAPALAQDVVRHRHVARTLQAPADSEAPVTFRGLTINRPPDSVPAPGDDQDIYRDGSVRYNDIRDFSPSPYTTSGVQYPYGLDGIGGYGSSLDIGSGQDTALYNRGAGTP